MLKPLTLCMLCAFSGHAIAKNTYLGVDYFQTSIAINDDSTKPAMTSVRLGTQVYKQIMVEAQYSSSNKTDKLLNFEFDLEQSMAVYARFETPTYNGFKIDIALGYADNEMAVTGAPNTFNDADNYAGFSWGVGVYQNLPYIEQAHVKLGYQSLYSSDELKIDGLTLGFGYTF